MRKTILLLMLTIVMIFAACSKTEESDGPIAEKEKPVKKEEQNQYPFTGLMTNDEVTNRAVTVMVNNHTQARPQSGLSQADIVIEVLAEGNITRFLALYQSKLPEIVGPVRSAREYYFELANGYDALYVYHGAANFVNDMIRSRGIENLNGAIYDNDGRLFKRESFRRAPHNSYLLFDSVYEEADSKGYDIEHTYEPLLFLQENDTIDGEAVNHVHIDYSNNGTATVEYEYDDSSETYKRFSDNEQTKELNSEEPIEVSNVFIIETYHEVFDNEGRRKVDINSGGNAYLLQKGQLQQVEWKNDNGRIVPIKEGKTIGFVPGKTWINIVPTNPGIEQSVTYSQD